VVEPSFAFHTNFYTSNLQKYLKEFKIDKIYEKPINLSKLRKLLLESVKETVKTDTDLIVS
jgi:hypothetical protein